MLTELCSRPRALGEKVFDFLVSALTVDMMSCTCGMNHEFALHECETTLGRTDIGMAWLELALSLFRVA